MNDSEKLSLACECLRHAIRNESACSKYERTRVHGYQHNGWTVEYSKASKSRIRHTTRRFPTGIGR